MIIFSLDCIEIELTLIQVNLLSKVHFKKIKENNGLDNSITFHTLRHSYATEFIKNGGDIWELKNILGHSSINTTSIYLHMAENFKDVYSPLNKVSSNV